MDILKYFQEIELETMTAVRYQQELSKLENVFKLVYGLEPEDIEYAIVNETDDLSYDDELIQKYVALSSLATYILS